MTSSDDWVDPTLARLLVYQEARTAAALARRVTNRWPPHERDSLGDQIRRSADSVYANIAEGHGRTTQREKARFFSIAWSSLTELRAHLEQASASALLPRHETAELRTHLVRTTILLAGLRRSISQ
ncbi:MAG: four helix bundle protein [Gemmatirosa sp.]|nr:four helix bundle protein [Gemmatirosa sp.]